MLRGSLFFEKLVPGETNCGGSIFTMTTPWLALHGTLIKRATKTVLLPCRGSMQLWHYVQFFSLDKHLLVMNADNVNYVICGLDRDTYLHRKYHWVKYQVLQSANVVQYIEEPIDLNDDFTCFLVLLL